MSHAATTSSSPAISIVRAAFVLGAFFALTGVVLGALGAHALEERLATGGNTVAWQTAVAYQMWHALALLFAGLAGLAGVIGLRPLRTIVAAFAVGILFFSGSIFALSMGGPRFLGPITPLGGLALIAGWGIILVIACRFRPHRLA